MTLLAVPALPSSLPLPSLTHLSTHLPLFTVLLPLAASRPALLTQGRLSSELGKTYFLANLVIFGITGGMLQRYGSSGAATWVAVIGTILSHVGVGWGRWAEGILEDEDTDMLIELDSDSEGESSIPVAPKRRSSNILRPPLPINIQPKLLLLTSPSHLSTLANLLTSPTSKAPTSLLVEFASFALSLLCAFRGSPRWESILDALMGGQRGRALGRRLWREGVRGRWRNAGERAGWDTFSENPSTPCLLVLTHLYNHYLLLTPDDEFFSANSTNPISVDEVLELAGIWRDLAFWGYMIGVAGSGVVLPKGPGTEETRALFTRGVTRVAERK